MGSSNPSYLLSLANSKGEMTHSRRREADITPLQKIYIGGITVVLLVVCVVWVVPLNRSAVVVEKVTGDRRRYSYASYDAVELL